MENIEIIENIETPKIQRGRPIKTDKNPKTYYQNFKLKHPDIIKNKIDCPLCAGKYTYYTKSSHNKSKLHKRICALYNV